MNRYSTLALLLLAGFTGEAAAQGTEALLKDGTLLTIKQPLQLWGVEGPITDLHAPTSTFSAMGQRVPVPRTIDGENVSIDGTSFLTNAGNLIPMRTNHVNRLRDNQATALGATGLMGATRSLYSFSAGLAKDPASVAQMTSNHRAYVNGVIGAYEGVLAPERIQAIVDEADALVAVADAANGVGAGPVPAGVGYTGGTLKAAGHVYVDALTGEEHLVPDLGLVVELAENVLIGTIRAVDPGDAFTPPSLLVGDLLVIMNQDERFGQELLGFGLLPMEPEVFFAQLQPGSPIAVGGYAVGDHVLYGISLEAETLIDPAAGLVVGVTKWRFDADEVRMTGVTSQSDGISLEVEFRIDGAWTDPEDMGLELDPLVPGGGSFSYRLRDEPDAPLIDRIRVRAYDANGTRIYNEVFNRANVDA
jgi:hypothetical protein